MMDRIPPFGVFEAGGELAGNLGLIGSSYEDALEYLELHGQSVKRMPNFMNNYEDAKILVSNGWKERNEMPVVSQKQMKKLQKQLERNVLTDDGKPVKFSIRKVKASSLKPVQKEIYLDKSLDRIIADDLSIVYGKLKAAKFIASNDEFLVDGHHKWLTTMLLDPSMFIRVLFVDLPFNDLLGMLEDFEEEMGNEKNE